MYGGQLVIITSYSDFDQKAYIKDDKLAVNVYVDKEIDVDEVIKEYNKIVPAYERIKYHKVFNDSIDTRLKQ